MPSLTLLSACLTGLLAAVCVQASVLTPAVLPLIVRNPYLNTHLRNARDVPWSKWPIFWTGAEVGMSLMASVPGSSLVYPLLGRPHDSLTQDGSKGYNISYPTYLGAQYDASTTNLTYRIPAPKHSDSKEPLELVISFLSPITPTSTLRQSIPASYVVITASGSFDIDVYMDLNGHWVTADANTKIQWNYADVKVEDNPSLRSFQFKRNLEMKFSEINDRAEYGKLYFMAPSDVTYEVGTSGDIRQAFARNGNLKNRVDKNFRNVVDKEPAFAFHKSFQAPGGNSTFTESCRFTIAHIRDEVAQFAAARGLTEMRPLWKSYYLTDSAVLIYHYFDYYHAKKLADEYSAKVIKDATKAGGEDYADIVLISARQVMGATDFAGTPDDPLLLIKEISSDGNAQTIDIIFPAFPFFAYTNPMWLAYMLEPLLEHMLSGQYPNKYAMHDLGFNYPNLTGHPLGLDEYMPVEESGDMLIMALSLVHSLIEGVAGTSSEIFDPSNGVSEVEVEEGKSPFPLRLQEWHESGILGLDEPMRKGSRGASEAKSWLKRSWKLWKQWTEYLVDFALVPENQLSTDDFAGWLPYQTNLALKGIVGIKAMSELAAVMGHGDEVKYYQNISETYIAKWQEYGMSRDGLYAKLAYNWYGSWTTLYSLFADAILCFHTDYSDDSLGGPSSSGANKQAPIGEVGKAGEQNFLPHSIYQKQSAFYALALQKYGLPLDSRHLYGKSDWEFQTAAAASPALRKNMVGRLARWINESNIDTPLTDLHQTEGDGGYAVGTHFTNRPVIGSHFSLLAMDKACGGNGLSRFTWDEQQEAKNLKISNAERDWPMWHEARSEL